MRGLIVILGIFVGTSVGCGPPKDMAAPVEPDSPTADARVPAARQPSQPGTTLVGTWDITMRDEPQGTLELRDDGTFTLIETNVKEPGIKVSISGSYVVEGDLVHRTLENATVEGATAERASEIKLEAAKYVGQTMTGRVVSLNENSFELRDENGNASVYKRRTNP